MTSRLLLGEIEQAQLARDLNAEPGIQAAVVEWIRLTAPSVFSFACPNGGYPTKAEAARLKWTGVLAGVPDLAIVAPRIGQLIRRLGSDQDGEVVAAARA